MIAAAGLVGWGETVESMVAAIRFPGPHLLGRDPAAFAANLDAIDWPRPTVIAR